MAQTIEYKIVVDQQQSEKGLTTLRQQIIALEKQLVSFQKAGKDTEISFGKPNEFKKTEESLKALKSQLESLSGGANSVTTDFAAVTAGLNSTAGALVGVVGQAAGLNTALQGTNEVLSEQVFAQQALDTVLNTTTDTINKETESLNELKSTASQPITLDVNTDKEQIDALIQASGNAQEQLNILNNTPVEIEVTDPTPQLDTNVKKVNTSIGALRKEVLALQNELESTEVGTEKYAQLESQLLQTSARLADVKDRTEDLADAIQLQTGSAVERANKSFGLLRDGVANLDFGKITTALKGLGGAFKSVLTPSTEFRSSLSNLGKGIVSLDFNKFKSGLSGVSTGFKGLGKAIAATGIGALVIGVTTLIANFDKLKTSGGVVGQIFTAIGDAIGFVTDKVFALTDALGLTDIKSKATSERIASNSKKQSDSVVKDLERQIAVQKALGKSTFELEKQLRQERRTQAEFQKLQLEQQIKDGKTLSDQQLEDLENYKLAIADLNAETTIAYADETKNIKAKAEAAKAGSKEVINSYEQEIETLKANKELELELIQSLADQNIISKEEENARKLKLDLDYLTKQADLYRKQAEKDGIISEAERQTIILQGTNIKLKEDEIKKQEELNKNKKEEEELQTNITKSIKDANDEYDLQLQITQDLVDKGLITQEESTKRNLENTLKLNQALLDIAITKANQDGIVTPEEVKNINDAAVAVQELQNNINNLSKPKDSETSILGGLFTVSEEEKQALIDGALNLANSINDIIFANQQENNQRRLENSLNYLSEQEQAELDAIDSRNEKALISDDVAEQQKLEVQAKYNKLEEQQKKAAFEREKRLKLAQAAADLALAIFRIKINTAASIAAATTLGPAGAALIPVIIANGSAQIIASIAGFAIASASILAQKFAKGGEVKYQEGGGIPRYQEGGLAVGPSHSQGGIKGIVGDRPIEFEGGEYIVKAAAVQKYGANLFDNLNSMKFAEGGAIPAGASAFVSNDFTSTTEFAASLQTVVPLLEPNTNKTVVYVSDITSAQDRLSRNRTRVSYGGSN